MEKINYLYKIARYCWRRLRKIIIEARYQMIKNNIRITNIASIEETIDRIIKNKASVSRFGDGEIKWLLGIPQKSFQDQNNELSFKLAETIKSDCDGCLVCLPQALISLDGYASEKDKLYYKETYIKIGNKLNKYLDKKRKYYNSNITRFYVNGISREKAAERFKLLKKIWENRNVIIVEGEYSRLGVGNDLLSNAKSIRRIIAPAKNAFSVYSEIVNATLEEYKADDLVLAALGPTATVLAYDLYRKGIQTIDIGHVDVEYEWFLRGEETKVAIPGKAVNEAIVDLSSEMLPDDVYSAYLSQIVKYVKNSK